jgi:nucleoside-diphosphate-sugar epimerase
VKAVLVTGAAGFIGGYVVDAFVREGWRVIAMIHRTQSPRLAELARQGRIALVTGDVRNAADIAAALAGGSGAGVSHVDAVVHCAGRASDVGRRSAFRRTNFDAVKILVEALRHTDAARLVFVSTTDVYGLHDFHGEAEDELPLGAYPSNPYPEFKIRAEAYIRARLPPERFAIVRPAQVWGIGDTTLTARIVDFLRGSPWIVHFGPWRGRNRWPLAHVRNVATACVLAAVRPEAAGRAINVLDDDVTSIDSFYRLLADVYLPGKRHGVVTLPLALGRIFGATVSAVSNALNLDRPFVDPSHYALYAVSRNLDFSNARMRTLFAAAGRQPITLAAGLAELRRSRPAASGPTA